MSPVYPHPQSPRYSQQPPDLQSTQYPQQPQQPQHAQHAQNPHNQRNPNTQSLPPFRHLDPDAYGAAQVLTTIYANPASDTNTPPNLYQQQQQQQQYSMATLAPRGSLVVGMQADFRNLARTLLPLPRIDEGGGFLSGTGVPGGGVDNGAWSGSGIGGMGATGGTGEYGVQRPIPAQILGSGSGKRRYDSEGTNTMETTSVSPQADGMHRGDSSTITPLHPVPSSSAPATFKPEFQFVVNEDAKQARQTVRKHVMREYRRRERFEQGGSKKTGPRGKSTTRTPQPNPARKAPLPRICFKAESPASESTCMEASPPSRGSTVDGGERPGTHVKREPSGLPHGTKRRKPSPDVDAAGTSFLDLPSPTATDIDFDRSLTSPAPSSPATSLGSLTPAASASAPDPWAAVARSQVDPFSAINFDCGPSTQALLHHFAWVMPSIMDEMVAGTNFHRIGWLYSCVAVHDPTPVSVILGFTLAHIAQCRGTPEPPLAIEHKNKALQLINHRMEDPVEALSEGTIGAVVNIAGYELVDSNPESFAMHMRGLFRMVSERGGMVTLRNNANLEDIIVRLDVLRAYIAISHPRYPNYSSVRSLEPIAINIPPSTMGWDPLHMGSEDRKEVYRFCEDSIYLVHALEDFMLLSGSAATRRTDDLDASMHALLASAVKQLLRRDSFDASEASHLSRKCCRLAALIFIDLAIRELFDSPSTSGQFVHDLKSRLLGTMTPWSRSLEMLVMVLIKHDRVALEKAWRAWYIADVVTMTMNLGEETWKIAEKTMHEYILHEAVPAETGPRTSLVWNMRQMADAFMVEWN